MRNIKILGTGCAKCQQTTTAVKQAIIELGLTEVQVEKVEDIQKIMEYNILRTPAVVIDEIVKIKGRVPTVREVKELLVQLNLNV